MMNFPTATTVRKRLPKEAFYRHLALTNALKEKFVSDVDRIMVETDAPYMAPTPFRGKRCDSRYVYRMVETIAEIKGLTPAEVEQATTEIQQETPMGAYAVEYITASSRSQRGYYEISLQISYRRTAEQIQAVVNATSTEALSALLEAALDEGRYEQFRAQMIPLLGRRI